MRGVNGALIPQDAAIRTIEPSAIQISGARGFKTLIGR